MTTQQAAATSAPDWSALRSDFPTTQKLCYLNLANKAILPRTVERSMLSWMRDIYEDVGEAAFAMGEIEKTRAAVANLFGAPADCVALIKNTSEGVNIVAQGFPWRQGDNVVISEFEHENNTFPWRHLAQRGIEVRIAAPDESGRVTVDQYRELVDDRTRIVAAAWVVYGNGWYTDLPAPALAADAHRFEYGNPNFLGCWVPRRSAEYIKGIGLANIEARVRVLTTLLIDLADKHQVKVRTPRPWEQRAGIVSLDLGGHAADPVRKLQDQGVIVAEKDGHLRASIHFYNNEEDIERFFHALQKV